jgi:hypothetical protein
MGITNLNDIQKYSVKSKYNPKTFKANTIIIDGNNLLFNRLTAIRASFMNTYLNVELGTIDKPLLYQLVSILNATIKGIVDMITNYYYNSLKDEKNIIIVFDPPNTPNYYIPGAGMMTLKRKEEENRISKQKKQFDKYQIKIDELKMKYSDEVELIYNQLSYLLNDSNIKKLMPIIKNELAYIYRKDNENSNYTSEFNFPQQPVDICNHVYLIQSISEADLVIYNLAKLLNYAPVLIRSMDSDYYILCSNLENVYKRDISDKTKNKTNKYEDTLIYNIWNIWREVFDSNITYKDIITMATMAGNDYTAKTSLYGFKIDGYKRIYQGNFSKITKSAKHLYPYVKAGYNNINDIIEKYCENNEDARNSMLIYNHIDDNFLFDELKISTFKLNDLVMKIKNELNNEFYDYVNDITDVSIIENPCEYIHNIIQNINTIENATQMAEMNIDFGNVNFEIQNENVNINTNENVNLDKNSFGNINFGNVNFEIQNVNQNINLNINQNVNQNQQLNINSNVNQNQQINLNQQLNENQNKNKFSKNILNSIDYSNIVF